MFSAYFHKIFKIAYENKELMKTAFRLHEDSMVWFYLKMFDTCEFTSSKKLVGRVCHSHSVLLTS